jgi:transposase-like protein
MAMTPSRAIRNVFGERVVHRTNGYLNNYLEQDHRGVKQRYRPMCGLKSSPPLRVSPTSLTRSELFAAPSRTATNLSYDVAMNQVH